MRFIHGLITAGMALSVSAKGINCDGSNACGNPGFKLTDLLSSVQGIDNSRWYQNGEHIVCWEAIDKTGFCAFLQGTGGMPGNAIKALLQDIVNHGCGKCGSVPVFFPSDNDISHHGELTVNYVFRPNCQGVC